MMAVASSAEDGTRPPYEVTMAGRIKQYGDPWGGGWMSWPAGLANRLTIADNIYNAFKSLGRYDGSFGDWQKAHPFDAAIWHEITALRMAKKAASNGN